MSPRQPPRAGSIRNVAFFHAPGCHLCEEARRTVGEVRAEVPFALVEVDISGDPDLELRYRPWLPVVEIDGERAFYFTVPADELRARLTKSGTNPAV